ncbi:MAG TPA: hypothetical protein VKQ32_24355 [Polyangia bacterium]|nr:hypothetical protein [Polyangia bacterium]
MFGFGKPDVPPDEVVDWLFLAFAWLLRETGGWEPFSKARLILPTPDFFPIGGEGPDLAAGLLYQVKQHAGMDDWPVKLEEHEDDPSREELFGRIAMDGSDHGGAAGTFRGHGGAGLTSIITYSPKLLTEPEKLVATLAHEIGHYLLHDAETAPPGGWEREEQATDVCAVFLGFGVFLANSAFTYSQWAEGGWHGWRTSRLGYLNEQTLAYALGIFLRLRGLEPKPALKHLDANPKSYLKDALTDLDRRRIGSLIALRPAN